MNLHLRRAEPMQGFAVIARAKRTKVILIAAIRTVSQLQSIAIPDKLDWFNQQHIGRLAPADLAHRVEPVLKEAGLWSPDLGGSRRDWFLKLLELVRPRVKRMGQFADELRPFLVESIDLRL